MQSSDRTIIFIYNANSGMANALIDFGKKYIAPASYDCQLCMVSYGPFGMKRDWKNFVGSLPYPVRFLHKDELAAEYPNALLDLPAVAIFRNGRVERELLSGSAFADITSLERLKAAVLQSLNEI